jgi:hypothetical protein
MENDTPNIRNSNISPFFLQIADTDGRLLAAAMAEHMGREEWVELDLDEHYAEQVTKGNLFQFY